MSEIKSVVSVIKILERTIGILENCNDFGKIPDATRKRVIEMLNKATLEIYFDNVREDSFSDEQTVGTKETAEIKSKPETVPEEYVEENIPEKEVIETVSEEYLEKNIPEQEVMGTVSEEYTEEIISEEEYFPEEEYAREERVIIHEEEYISEEEIVGEEENLPEEDIISEKSVFRQQDSDKPIIEWEPARETQENKETEINMLRLQLEEERRRLEQELQNWQDERRKKDEEIHATQKLLEALQQQVAANRTQQAQTQQSKPQQQSRQSQAGQQSQTSQQSQPATRITQPSQPQQPANTEPLIRKEAIVKKTVRKEEDQESATLIDSYIGSKKVLHENFESTNMVNQISTPVSSLSKAIGINDKFRFIKELFGGDSDLYNETVKILDTKGSLIAAISYIESNFSWDKNSDSVKQLISLVRRRYM